MYLITNININIQWELFIIFLTLGSMYITKSRQVVFISYD